MSYSSSQQEQQLQLSKAACDMEDAPVLHVTEALVRRVTKTPLNRSLRDLKVLNLQSSPSKGKVRRLDGMAHLTPSLATLNLSSNRIGSLDGLRGLSALRELDVSNNQLTSLTGLEAVPQLVRLNVSDNLLERLPRLLRQLTRLQVFRCARNKLCTLNDVGHLRKLPDLVNLDVQGNPLMQLPHAREFLIFTVRTIDMLNGAAVSDALRLQARQRFDQSALERLVDRVRETTHTNKDLLSKLQDELSARQHAEAHAKALQADLSKSASQYSQIGLEMEAKNKLLASNTAQMVEIMSQVATLRQEASFRAIEDSGHDTAARERVDTMHAELAALEQSEAALQERQRRLTHALATTKLDARKQQLLRTQRQRREHKPMNNDASTSVVSPVGADILPEGVDQLYAECLRHRETISKLQSELEKAHHDDQSFEQHDQNKNTNDNNRLNKLDDDDKRSRRPMTRLCVLLKNAQAAYARAVDELGSAIQTAQTGKKHGVHSKDQPPQPISLSVQGLLGKSLAPGSDSSSQENNDNAAQSEGNFEEMISKLERARDEVNMELGRMQQRKKNMRMRAQEMMANRAAGTTTITTRGGRSRMILGGNESETDVNNATNTANAAAAAEEQEMWVQLLARMERELQTADATIERLTGEVRHQHQQLTSPPAQHLLPENNVRKLEAQVHELEEQLAQSRAQARDQQFLRPTPAERSHSHNADSSPRGSEGSAGSGSVPDIERAALHSLRRELAALQDTTARERAEGQRVNESLRMLTKEKNELESETNVARDSMAQCSRDLEHAEKRLESLQLEHNKLSRAIDAALQLQNEHKQRVKLADQEMSARDTAIVQTAEKLKDLQREQYRLEACKQAQETQVSELEKERLVEESKLHELRAKTETEALVLAQQARMLTDRKTELATVTYRVAEERETLDELEHDVSVLTQSHQATIEKHETAVRQLQHTQLQYVTKQQEVNVFKQKLQEWQARQNASAATLVALQEECDLAQQALERKREQIEQCTSDERRARQAADEARQLCEEVEKTARIVTDNLNSQQAVLEALTRQVEETDALHGNTLEETQQLKQSVQHLYRALELVRVELAQERDALDESKRAAQMLKQVKANTTDKIRVEHEQLSDAIQRMQENKLELQKELVVLRKEQKSATVSLADTVSVRHHDSLGKEEEEEEIHVHEMVDELRQMVAMRDAEIASVKAALDEAKLEVLESGKVKGELTDKALVLQTRCTQLETQLNESQQQQQQQQSDVTMDHVLESMEQLRHSLTVTQQQHHDEEEVEAENSERQADRVGGYEQMGGAADTQPARNSYSLQQTVQDMIALVHVKEDEAERLRERESTSLDAADALGTRLGQVEDELNVAARRVEQMSSRLVGRDQDVHDLQLVVNSLRGLAQKTSVESAPRRSPPSSSSSSSSPRHNPRNNRNMLGDASASATAVKNQATTSSAATQGDDNTIWTTSRQGHTARSNTMENNTPRVKYIKPNNNTHAASSFRRTPYRDRELEHHHNHQQQQHYEDSPTTHTHATGASRRSRQQQQRDMDMNTTNTTPTNPSRYSHERNAQEIKSTMRKNSNGNINRTSNTRRNSHTQENYNHEQQDNDDADEEDGRSGSLNASGRSMRASSLGGMSSSVGVPADVEKILDLVARMKRERESELEGKLGVHRITNTTLPVGWRSTQQPHLISRWARGQATRQHEA